MEKYEIKILKQNGAIKAYTITARWLTLAEQYAEVVREIVDGQKVLSIRLK